MADLDLSPDDPAPPPPSADELAAEEYRAGERSAPWPADEPDHEPWPDEELPEPLAEESVRDWLTTAGATLHFALPHRERVPDVWLMTQGDLDLIAPPLTRILNRYPAAARVAALNMDPLTVAVGAGLYAWRNVTDIRDAAPPDEPRLSSTRRHADEETTEHGMNPADPSTWPTVGAAS